MRLSSPRVRGFEFPEDCIDMLAVIGPRSAVPPGRTALHRINSIRVRYRRRAGASPLSSVDAAPTREGTRQGAPGDQIRSEARQFAASTIGPTAAWRQ